jgi:Fe-Mn family superoxide dismutase
MTFIEQQFEIPKLDGISETTITEHLKLYAGYVKNANLVQQTLKDLYQDREKNIYQISELHRRFSFEFDGMKNHELYFEQFVGGKKDIDPSSTLALRISETWGSFETWRTQCMSLCMTRGIGWACLVHDPVSDSLINTWVDEQHLGHLAGVNIILAIDMWEHSYLLDFVPSEKKKYIDAFFANLNFSVLEKRYISA